MTQPPGSNASFSLKVPMGDDRPRQVCETCGFVDYVNPKVIVGSVCGWLRGRSGAVDPGPGRPF